MSVELVIGEVPADSKSRISAVPGRGTLAGILRSIGLTLCGIGALLVVWSFGGWVIAMNPSTAAFANFAPEPTFARLVQMVQNGEASRMTLPSLGRIIAGMAWAIALGIPLGILVGRFRVMREASTVPFQFLRMISPLAWMPIAVMAFATWNRAIIFLVAIASVWPVLFSTAHGVRRIDPAWFRVARNLGARPWHMLFVIILPAIAQDTLTGVRLALGVAWVVLVPAEFLGVTSGLGYAINDARDTLEYDRLAATVLIIGVIGYSIDFACQKLIAHLSWFRED